MKRVARTEDGVIAAYFGPLDDPLYQVQVEVSLDRGINDTWEFFHTDDKSCALEVGVAYPGISLFRFFSRGEPFELSNN